MMYMCDQPSARFWSNSGIGVWLESVLWEDQDLASSTDSYRTDPSFSVCAGPCPVSVIIGPHYIGTDQSPHVRTSVDNLAESSSIRTHVNVPGHARAVKIPLWETSKRCWLITAESNVRTWSTVNWTSSRRISHPKVSLVFNHSSFNRDKISRKSFTRDRLRSYCHGWVVVKRTKLSYFLVHSGSGRSWCFYFFQLVHEHTQRPIQWWNTMLPVVLGFSVTARQFMLMGETARKRRAVCTLWDLWLTFQLRSRYHAEGILDHSLTYR